MDMYQHDSAAVFRFVLRGELTGDQERDLECAWTTAKSTLAGKELVVDISGIKNADLSGVDLLTRMRESGARLTATLPPASEEILSSFGVPVAASSGWRHIGGWGGLSKWMERSPKRSAATGGEETSERTVDKAKLLCHQHSSSPGI